MTDLRRFQEWFADQELKGERGEIERLVRVWRHIEDAPEDVADALSLVRALALLDQPRIDELLEAHADVPDRFALALAAVAVALAQRAGVTL